MIMEKYITKNGIKYELRGEQYYPMLEIPEQTNYEIGKYGHLHLDFIKRHRKGTYTTLLTKGRLNEHLHSPIKRLFFVLIGEGIFVNMM